MKQRLHLALIILLSAIVECNAWEWWWNRKPAPPKTRTEQELFDEQVASWLGDVVLDGPVRQVRAALLPGGTMSAAGPAWGAMANCMPALPTHVYVVFSSTFKAGGEERAILPKMEALETRAGTIPLDRTLMGKLLENEAFASGTLNDEAIQRLKDLSAVIKVKLRTYKLIPLFLGESCSSDVIAEAILRVGDAKNSFFICVGTDEEQGNDFASPIDIGLGDRECQGAMFLGTLCGKLDLAPMQATLLCVKGKGPSAIVCQESQDVWKQVNRLERPSFVSEYDGKIMLEFARRLLEQQVRKETLPDVPVYVPALSKYYGCEVELELDGKSLGVASVLPTRQLLSKSLVLNTVKFCRDDAKVKLLPEHLPRLKLTLKILSIPEPVTFKTLDELYAKLAQTRPGAFLSIDGKTVGFIPDVWKQVGNNPSVFVMALCRRLGKTPQDLLTSKNVSLKTFDLVTFK